VQNNFPGFATILAFLVSLQFSQKIIGAPLSETNDPLAGANARIEAIRKAQVQITVLDSKGNPVAGAVVHVEQQRHAFLFGCNCFALENLQGAQREQYGKEFSALFNYATVPFYWGSYETQRGNFAGLRDKDKALATWCEAHHITMKGHPLVWHAVYPDWAPNDPDAAQAALHERVTNVIADFKSDIHYWDVVNEATSSARATNGVGHWVKRDGAAKVVETALQWAHEADPNAHLIYNDFNLKPEHYELIQQLVKDNAPFQVIGIQSHMHRREWSMQHVWDICERYAKFGKDIHFTEVTVVSGKHGSHLPPPWLTTPDGEQRQADYVEQFYTLLFSHPAVQAITWWDFEDYAWQGAPGGLVHADMTPKPAYDRLMKLIHQTWWTRESLSSDEKGACSFRGFMGDYQVTVQNGSVTNTINCTLSKGANNWVVTLGNKMR
jgi:endo-1,4-beta-xylanase